MTDIFARQRQLIGSTAEWAANDLLIGDGELAIERLVNGNLSVKIGDGTSKFSQLTASFTVGGGTAIANYITSVPAAGTTQIIRSGAKDDIPLVLKGAIGQTANVFEVRDVNNNILFAVDPTGKITVKNDAVAGGKIQAGSNIVSGGSITAAGNIYAPNLGGGSTGGGTPALDYWTSIKDYPAGAITPDFSTSLIQHCSVDQDITIDEPVDGKYSSCVIHFEVDASGPYNVTLGAGVKSLGTAVSSLEASKEYVAHLTKLNDATTIIQITEIV
jgi:hypothetical protein